MLAPSTRLKSSSFLFVRFGLCDISHFNTLSNIFLGPLIFLGIIQFLLLLVRESTRFFEPNVDDEDGDGAHGAVEGKDAGDRQVPHHVLRNHRYLNAVCIMNRST